MNKLEKLRIQALMQELGQLLPRTNAVVVMNVYEGGCGESQITATETGYLRHRCVKWRRRQGMRSALAQAARAKTICECVIKRDKAVIMRVPKSMWLRL